MSEGGEHKWAVLQEQHSRWRPPQQPKWLAQLLHLLWPFGLQSQIFPKNWGLDEVDEFIQDRLQQGEIDVTLFPSEEELNEFCRRICVISAEPKVINGTTVREWIYFLIFNMNNINIIEALLSIEYFSRSVYSYTILMLIFLLTNLCILILCKYC